MVDNPLFTAIVHTYNRPALLKEAVEALLRQTYTNLEIILINNGATAETIEYLNRISALDRRVKLVNFAENQYSWDDPVKFIHVCWNAALAEATGDYVWIQQDDDLLADDYVEKMVALFQDNPECTTAAGIFVTIDVDGNLVDNGPRTTNFRPRYMAGHELVLAMVRGNRSMFSSPGIIFTIKRDVLIKAGGYHRATPFSEVYGIVPFGVTGFDETAIFYYRRHEGQLNLKIVEVAMGYLGIKIFWSLLKEWGIERRWQIFGADVAREVVSYAKKVECRRAGSSFVGYLAARKFSSARRILVLMWYRRHFWSAVTVRAPRVVLIGPTRRSLKPVIRRGFKVFPFFGTISPRLADLRDRVER